MKKRIIALLSVAALAVGMFSTTASAAVSSSSWEVNYAKGAPTTSANPVTYKEIYYSEYGFNCYTYALSGGTVTLSSVFGGTINGGNITINSTSPRHLSTSNSAADYVRFKFVLNPTGTNATSNGRIQKV